MTHRGCRDASERSGIGEDEKQSETVRLAARWRRSNLVILIKFRKGNHLGEKKPKISFIQKKEGLFRGAPLGSRDTA